LAFHLTATRLGRNSSEGYADIGVDKNSPQTYRAGSLLVNGARLTEIYKDHVVLKRGDHSARLYLEGQTQPDGAFLNKAGSLLSAGGITATAIAPVNTRDSLTEVMRVTPVYSGDTLDGIQIYPATGSAGFRSLGLEPGDRIMKIDGAAVRDPTSAVNALRNALSGQAIAVVVRRGKETLSLSIDGSALRGSSEPP
jgi:type II secretory pathway component PulC